MKKPFCDLCETEIIEPLKTTVAQNLSSKHPIAKRNYAGVELELEGLIRFRDRDDNDIRQELPEVCSSCYNKLLYRLAELNQPKPQST